MRMHHPRLAALRSALALSSSSIPVSRPRPASLRSLEDSFLRHHKYLRISLTERCNLRCTYCMPSTGIDLTPSSKLLSKNEVITLASHFVSLGVNKIRLTGGEPTLRPDLMEVLKDLSPLRSRGLSTLALTTNGVLLGSGRLAQSLWEVGLDAINISLDTLQREKFSLISRRPPSHWDATWSGIQTALSIGWGYTPQKPLKINCVVQKGVNDDEAASLVETLTRCLPIELRFIEFMPFCGNGWGNGELMVPSSDLLSSLRATLPNFAPALPRKSSTTTTTMGSVGGGRITSVNASAFSPHTLSSPAPLSTHHISPQPLASEHVSSSGGTCGVVWRGAPDWLGSVGFISTLSSAFCASCSRLRLTADGNFRVCLHDSASREVSLRDILRKGDGAMETSEKLTEAIEGAVWRKFEKLGGATYLKGGERSDKPGERPMIKMGG